MYGFIPITEWEEKIINSPFFQRLRWIKQLGFANYIFPGAEHNRFAHAIGVMHSMDKMIRAIGIGVPDHELFDKKTSGTEAMLHKCLRISALLHDIGTFPFSHSVEFGYIRHGNDKRITHGSSKRGRSSSGAKDLPNSHEHLGSFIIKNTRFDGGITRILEDYQLDVNLISKIIKGDSPYLIANQLMHSDLDADRMDYLLRDSHYTGIKYGQFDRDYILANLTTFDAGAGQRAFGVRDHAGHAVEDFLIARFSWYSQVIRNHAGAKFDIMASYLTQSYLENDLVYQFHDLLAMVESKDERFFWWNDIYFLNRCQEIRFQKLHRDPKINELNEMLLYRKSPRTLNHPLFERRVLKGDTTGRERTNLKGKIEDKVHEFEKILKKHGRGNEWLLVDIPRKDVFFTQPMSKISSQMSKKQTGAKKTKDGLYRDPESVKLVDRHGKPSLLVENENSLMKHLSDFSNFIPSVYANHSAFQVLKGRNLVD